jgi:kynurenine formamidase
MEKYNIDTTIAISRIFYDLTEIISKDMPTYPGNPQPVVEHDLLF